MRKGKGYGLLVKDWLWAGLFLGLAVCNVPFNYEVNVLDYAAFSGTFTVEQGDQPQPQDGGPRGDPLHPRQPCETAV